MPSSRSPNAPVLATAPALRGQPLFAGEEPVVGSGFGTAELVRAVAGLARLATGQFTVDKLLCRLVDLAAEHLSADGAGVMVAAGAELRCVQGSTTDVERVGRLQELMQQGPCRDAMEELRELMVMDLGVGDLPPEWEPYRNEARKAGLRSVVAVPLVSRGRGWGVLDLYRCRPGSWSPEEIAAARVLADVAVSYVVMAADRDEARQAQRELAHRSTHDELTGLPNRALLFDRLEHALTAAARHEQAVAVFFIDIDSFKQINDTFGHAIGDRVLVEATRRIADTLRSEDTFARLSGDEFVVVCERLPQQAEGELDAQLDAVARRIRSALSVPIRIGDVDLVVTASIGVAVSERPSTGGDLVWEADAAMYRAKQRRQEALAIRTNSGPSLRSVRHLDRELTSAPPGG
jgi:diguanylate cyclase (GGDEF)-like protein